MSGHGDFRKALVILPDLCSIVIVVVALRLQRLLASDLNDLKVH